MYLIIRVNQNGDSYITFHSISKARERFAALVEDDHSDDAIFLVKAFDGEEFGIDQNNYIYGGAEFIDHEIFNL